MMFPEDELLGVDIVTPDLTYLKENRQHVRALLLTHGHEDHIGAVAFFLAEFDVPVYGTPSRSRWSSAASKNTTSKKPTCARQAQRHCRDRPVQRSNSFTSRTRS
jgi:mRNA degradation ribonuclease J1/J2